MHRFLQVCRPFWRKFSQLSNATSPRVAKAKRFDPGSGPIQVLTLLAVAWPERTQGNWRIHPANVPLLWKLPESCRFDLLFHLFQGSDTAPPTTRGCPSPKFQLPPTRPIQQWLPFPPAILARSISNFKAVTPPHIERLPLYLRTKGKMVTSQHTCFLKRWTFW